MQLLKKTILFYLVVVISTAASAQSEIPEKVLFVGNSYTYFWNLPQTVAQMAIDKGISMATRQSTVGGSNLGQHWRAERGLKSVNLIKEGDFDAVVLQDFSMSAINTPDSLLHYGKLLGDLIKSKGAQAYLYMTWAREWDPYMQAKFDFTTFWFLKLRSGSIKTRGAGFWRNNSQHGF